MGTVAANPPPSPSSACGLQLESLTYIEMSKLSQSELQALSFCSNSAFDLRRTDDVVVPNIDRSLFNESAGSRRQTYSRLRGSDLHHHHHHHRARLPGLLPRPKLPPSSDPENHSVLHYLKHYLKYNSSLNCPPPPPPAPPPSPPPLPPQQVVLGGLEHQLELGLQEKMALAVHAAGRKRKRGRKAKVNAERRLLENGIGVELARVNKKGEEVDLTALERDGDDLYSGELRKRTMGLETEEGVLEFLRGLEGQWGSRRRKRKYVDASEFGDSLPNGWKLLLGLRRRDGRVSVYCRRIVRSIHALF